MVVNNKSEYEYYAQVQLANLLKCIIQRATETKRLKKYFETDLAQRVRYLILHKRRHIHIYADTQIFIYKYVYTCRPY